MWPVSYAHRLDYSHDLAGKRFPRLTFRVSNPADPSLAVDVKAYLDSGSERSLFDGRIGALLGVDILRGERIRFASATGSSFTATIHPVRLVHEDLGRFDLEVGFSTGELQRNLLGRDFFDLIQIGFRENQLAFFVTPRP